MSQMGKMGKTGLNSLDDVGMKRKKKSGQLNSPLPLESPR